MFETWRMFHALGVMRFAFWVLIINREILDNWDDGWDDENDTVKLIDRRKKDEKRILATRRDLAFS